jgi:putative FmdB family regulatory protein
MPIYEYICLDCKNRFDAIRSMKDADSPIRCDHCESDHTSRMISVFYAQSAGKVVAGGNAGGCAGCSGGTCSTCGH